MMQSIESMTEYARQVQGIINHIEHNAPVQFESKTQFAFAFLCELFEVSPVLSGIAVCLEVPGG